VSQLIALNKPKPPAAATAANNKTQSQKAKQNEPGAAPVSTGNQQTTTPAESATKPAPTPAAQ
jgi:hypothetical protein